MKKIIIFFTQFKKVIKEARRQEPEFYFSIICLFVIPIVFVIVKKVFDDMSYHIETPEQDRICLVMFYSLIMLAIMECFQVCFMIQGILEGIDGVLWREEQEREERREMRRIKFEKAGYELRELEEIIDKGGQSNEVS